MAVKNDSKKVATKAAPASKPVAKKGAATPVKRKGESIGLFVDLDNTNMSPDNLMEAISILQTKGHVSYGKLYGYTDEKAEFFEEIVVEHKFETVGKLRMKTDSTSMLDPRLLFECLEISAKHKFDHVFVWAGVGDMIPLFSRLRDLKCKVMTIDNTAFDCANKFVDQAIKLYSPFSFVNQIGRGSRVQQVQEVAPVQQVVQAPVPQRPAAPEVAQIFGSVPDLPRKKGAPEFAGVAQRSSQDDYEDDEDLDDDEDDDENDDYEAAVNIEAVFHAVNKVKQDAKAGIGADMTFTPEASVTGSKSGDFGDDDFAPIVPGAPNLPRKAGAPSFDEAAKEVQSSSQVGGSHEEKVAGIEDKMAKIERERAELMAKLAAKGKTGAVAAKPPAQAGGDFDDFGEVSGSASGSGYADGSYVPGEDAAPKDEVPANPADTANDFNTF
jgi:hypothetical protein